MTVAEPTAAPLTTARIQLALNVADLDEAVTFYSRLFGTEPAKRKPGYANFAITEPPLKLVLIESADAAGRLNHLGVEVPSTDDVTTARRRLAGEGLTTVEEDQVTCCFAVQDKVWVEDPDGAPWEIYTVLAHSDELEGDACATSSDVPCACG